MIASTTTIRMARKQLEATTEARRELEKLLAAARVRDSSDMAQRSQLGALMEEMLEIALSSLDYLPRLQRLWGGVNGKRATELGTYRKAVEEVRDLGQEASAHFERLLEDMQALEQDSPAVKIIPRLQAGLLECQQVTGRAEELLAWLSAGHRPFDARLAEEARNAYQAGEFQEIGEIPES